MHKTSYRFWKDYDSLPKPVQTIASRKFSLLKTNPSHPSLQFKKIGKFWSVRISANYRALSMKNGDDFLWFWIGTHEDYERMLGK